MSKRQRLEALKAQRTHGKVYVGYVHPDSIDATFANSLLSLVEHDHQGPGHLAGRIYVGSGPRIASSRNLIVRQFLAMGGEWLLMLDCDMVFAPTLLDELLGAADSVERPIVGGLCFAGGKTAKYTPTLYRMTLDAEGQPLFGIIESYPKDALVRVDATGAACLLVHRSVFEGIEAQWAEQTSQVWFAETEYNKREFGEDVTFCMRAGSAGFPLHVHTGIRVGHRKLHTITEDLFDEQMERVAAGTQEDHERAHFKALGLLEKAA